MGPPIPIYEPLEDGTKDNVFLSKSYDATSHFETTTGKADEKFGGAATLANTKQMTSRTFSGEQRERSSRLRDSGRDRRWLQRSKEWTGLQAFLDYSNRLELERHGWNSEDTIVVVVVVVVYFMFIVVDSVASVARVFHTSIIHHICNSAYQHGGVEGLGIEPSLSIYSKEDKVKFIIERASLCSGQLHGHMFPQLEAAVGNWCELDVALRWGKRSAPLSARCLRAWHWKAGVNNHPAVKVNRRLYRVYEYVLF